MKNEKVFGLIIASALASSSMALAETKGDASNTQDKKDGEAPYCQTTKKGQSDCAAHGNASCAGQNKAAGSGFIKAGKDAKSCAKAGGKWSAT